jgi:hypothetical protein
MKKAAIAVTAMFIVALCAVAYAQTQQNTYSVTGSTSPTRTGSSDRPVPVGIKFGYTVGEASGNRPSPVRRYSIRFTGLRANTNQFPRCSSSRLENQGPDSCPRGSAVGSGFITNATGARSNPADKSIACNASLTVYNSGNNRAAIYVQGSPQSTDPRTRCAIELAAPIPARYVRRGSAMALEFDVPQTLLHPLPTLDNAVTSVTSTIRRVTRRRRGRTIGYYESTGGCRNGRRAISVVFTPESGAPSTASTTARCSR